MSTGSDQIGEAIRTARASGMRPSEVRRRLEAGTLEGVDRPVKLGERTFWRRWDEAKRTLARGRNGDGAPPFLEVMACEIVRYDNPEATDEDIAEATGFTPSYVRACLEWNERRLANVGVTRRAAVYG